MDFNSIMELLKPALVILIVATWGLGLILKSTKLDNGYIPLITVIIITALAVLYVLATSDISTMQLLCVAIFIGITQGIVAWLIGWKTYDKFIKNGLAKNNEGKG